MERKSAAYDKLADPSFYPGPQKEIRQLLSPSNFLKMLILVVIALFLQALVHDNRTLLNMHFGHFAAAIWSIQLLDNKSAATLLIGLVSVAFVNRQATLAYRPVLNYRSQQKDTSVFSLPALAKGEYFWAVNLQNVSSGPALVQESSYRVTMAGAALGEYETYEQALRKLNSVGLINGQTFVLRPISCGWCLAPKDECVIFEAALPRASKLQALDIKVTFKGLLGDEYVKQIYCIPRMGIYPNFESSDMETVNPR